MQQGDPTAPRRVSRRRLVLFRVVMVTLPLLAGLAAATAILVQQGRLVFSSPVGWLAGERFPIRFQGTTIYLEEAGFEKTGHRYVYDPLLGFRNVPGWRGVTMGNALTINALGLRGRETTLEKPGGTKRVLVLGDSFAWGYGVGDEQTFAAKLGSQLAGGKTRWEVLNAGVSGWGTDQEYLYLRSEGLHYAPDIVVLQFLTANDFHNNVNPEEYGMFKPMFLDTNLTLANVPVPKPGSKRTRVEPTTHAVPLTIAIIRRMAEVCAQNKCPLVVVKHGTILFPNETSWSERGDEFEETVPRIPNVHYLDLDAVFQKEDLSVDDVSLTNDRHWNPKGHAVAAQAIHQFLIERKLIEQ